SCAPPKGRRVRRAGDVAGALPPLPPTGPGPPQAHDLVTRLGAGRFGRSAVCGSEIGELGERRRGRPGAEDRRELMLVTDGTMLGAKLDDRLGFPRPDSGKLLQLERIGQIDAHLGGHGSPPSPEGVPGVSLGRGSRRLAAPRRGRRTALWSDATAPRPGASRSRIAPTSEVFMRPHLLFLLIGLVFLASPASAQVDQLLKGITGSGVTDSKASAGLKEALEVATEKAVSLTGRPNGYFG